ncbi:hypothetical protein NQZ79_g3311 [Umbelopsis isabellina]|nr:hypothetical protein NQZ79_g3311 [Umbelopsis isabellina]
MMRNDVAQKPGNKFSELQLTQGVALLMQGLEKSSCIIYEGVQCQQVEYKHDNLPCVSKPYVSHCIEMKVDDIISDNGSCMYRPYSAVSHGIKARGWQITTLQIFGAVGSLTISVRLI